jgi:predicted Zn-dependent protease
MAYAYLQLGQDQEAKRIAEELAAIQKYFPLRIDTGFAAVPARYALERGAWAEAAVLQPRASQFAITEAIGYFTRAIGAARIGEASRASEDIAHLERLREAALAKAEGYWAGQITVLVQAASAWVALAQGKDARALGLMREAADLEDASEKHVAMENRLYPMRELLGYMLLELGDAQAALKEFETSLEQTPNRLRGIYGAARSAQSIGNIGKARHYYAKLAALADASDSERREFQEAKAFLAQ